MVFLSEPSCTTNKILLVLTFVFVISNCVLPKSMNFKPNLQPIFLNNEDEDFKTEINLKNQALCKNQDSFKSDKSHEYVFSGNNYGNSTSNYVYHAKKKRHLAKRIKGLLLNTSEKSTCTPFFIRPSTHKKKMRFYQYMPTTRQPKNTLNNPKLTEVSVQTKKGKSKKLFGKINHSLPPSLITVGDENSNNTNTVNQFSSIVENQVFLQESSNLKTNKLSDESTLPITRKYKFIGKISEKVSKNEDLILKKYLETQTGPSTHQMFEVSNYNSTDLYPEVTNSFLKNIFKLNKVNETNLKKPKLFLTSNLTTFINKTVSTLNVMGEEQLSELSTNYPNSMYENALYLTESYSATSTNEFHPYTRLRIKDFFNFNNPLKSSLMTTKFEDYERNISYTDQNSNDNQISIEDEMISISTSPFSYDNMYKTFDKSQRTSKHPIKLVPDTKIKGSIVKETNHNEKMSDCQKYSKTKDITNNMENSPFVPDCNAKSLVKQINFNFESTSPINLDTTFFTSTNISKIKTFNLKILKLFSIEPKKLVIAAVSPNVTEESNTKISLPSNSEEKCHTTYLSEIAGEASTDNINPTSKQSKLLKRIFQSKNSKVLREEWIISSTDNSSSPMVGTQTQEPCSSSYDLIMKSELFEVTSQKTNTKPQNTKNPLKYKKYRQTYFPSKTLSTSGIASAYVTNTFITDESETEINTTVCAKTLADSFITSNYKNSKLKNLFNFKKTIENTVSSTQREFDPGGSSITAIESIVTLKPEELLEETLECAQNICNSLSPEEMKELLFLHTKQVNEPTTNKNWFVWNLPNSKKMTSNSANEFLNNDNLFKWFPKLPTENFEEDSIPKISNWESTTEASFNIRSSKKLAEPTSTENVKVNHMQNLNQSKFTSEAAFNINISKNVSSVLLNSQQDEPTRKLMPNPVTYHEVSNRFTSFSSNVLSKFDQTMGFMQNSKLSQMPHSLTTPSHFSPHKSGVSPTKPSRGSFTNKTITDHGVFYTRTAPVRPFHYTKDHINSFGGSEEPGRNKDKNKPITTSRFNKSNSNIDFNPKHFGLLLHNLTRQTNSTLLVNPLEVYQMDSNKTIPKLNISKEKQIEVFNQNVSTNDSSIWAYVMKPLESLVNVFSGFSPHNITKVGDINASTIDNGSLPSHLQPANSSLIILTVNSTMNDAKETRIGLWDFVGGFFHCLVETFAVPKPEDVHFYLYTRNNSLQPEELNLTEELLPTSTPDNNFTESYLPDPILEDGSTLMQNKYKRHYIDEDEDYEGFEPLKPAESGMESKWFNILRETKILVHGYRQNYQTDIVANMKDAYLNKSDVNVIVLDWSFVGDNPCYVIVAHHGLRCVGVLLAKFLDQLVEGGVSLSRVHLVGFSLGAHVAGHAGSETKHGLVSRITGLDPALPLIPMESEVSLDEGDATFVDIIHSAAGYLGQPGPMGHADFYPNGGAQQPGCDLASLGGCSHRRSAFYFIESITSEVGFQATLCDSWQNFQAGLCNSSSSLPMGEPCPSNASGKYFLLTALKEPYALVPEEHNKVKKSLLIDILNDIIYDL